MQSPEAICKQEFSEKLPRASIQDLGVVLMGAGYEVWFTNFFSCFARINCLSLIKLYCFQHVSFLVNEWLNKL